ncbi:MAG TPA: cell division ATP-binding protein FtsE [Patescibacteria group bacterium]|nr:cell division ATP-binding protein FtsE [Patescibacteria group bacterium]
MFEFKNVTKSFGKVRALESINLSIESGEFVYITGPSGSGKTTLLRLILQEILPDKGQVIFDGQDLSKLKIKDIPGLRQKIGVVFQDFKVIPEKTLWENVEIALAVSKVPEKDWKDRIAHVLSLVDIKNREDFFPSQLSGGELQRVSLARALVVNPKVVLADEPTGNLDWDTAEGIIDLFEKINKEGKTIIIATHHQGIIEKHKKRVIKLDKGVLTFDSKKKTEDNKSVKSDENKIIESVEPVKK